MSANGKHHVDWLALANAPGTSATMRDAILAAANGAPAKARPLGDADWFKNSPVPAGPVKKRRPKTKMPAAKKISKTETAYGELLKREFRGKIIRNQDWTARLLSGVRYTPDFTVWEMTDRGPVLLLCVEVKGTYRLGSAADSRTKFLTAAVDFPEISWRHVQKTADGWDVQVPPKQAA